MKRALPNSPGRLLAMLGLFVGVTICGWSADKRVWVEYAPGSKGNVVSALAKAGGHVHYEFDNINAVAVSLPEQALAGISHNPGVALVEDDPVRMMYGETIPYGIDLVQATKVWDALPAPSGDGVVDSGAPAGQGIVVGVIDSGVYKAHEDFAGVTINGESGTPTTWTIDGFGHGTHVTGTIAAANNMVGVVGVAPKIGGIYMVKVFGDDGAWAYSSSLLYAVQEAVSKGHAKVVSMSLGGSRSSRTEQRGLDQIYNSGNGALLVAAAGNAGDTSTSYPAGYSSVISVAAVDSTLAHASFSQTNSTVELSAPGVGVLSTVPFVETNTITVNGSTFSGNYIEGAARKAVSGILVDGGLGDTPSSSWAGKVVLVERGSIDFATKVSNVQSAGGVACVIYNNASGNFFGTLGTGVTSAIPAISLSLEDGTALETSALNQSASVISSVVSGSGYEAWDGTSMATPHVSGVAALIWSAKPSATAGQIRQVLDNTAFDLGTKGRDNTYGYGLVQAKAALDALVGTGGTGGDTTGPVLSNITAKSTNTKNGSFQITWTTDEASTSSVTIGLTGSASTTTSTSTALVTSHAMSFKGTKGANYTYTVSSTDASGNTSESDPKTFQN